jgi:exosortase C (VPDSG-CTERM-specific)
MALRRYLVFTAVLALAYANPLINLARLALRVDLYSHVLLVPAISIYLVWRRRGRLTGEMGGARWPGAIVGLAGLALLAVSWKSTGAGPQATFDQLAAEILSFCLLLWGGGFIILGGRMMRECAFPALFLIFITPLPSGMLDALGGALQRGSAEVGFKFIQLSGTPVFRTDLVFQMPGMVVEVARECSGIRSTLVLFITALLAGHLFLRSWWTRLLLAAVVFPLGIVRNAFRILVISMLCVHVDPSFISSPIHRHGGPLFFALFLIPFSLILFWMRRIDRPAGSDSLLSPESRSNEKTGSNSQP